MTRDQVGQGGESHPEGIPGNELSEDGLRWLAEEVRARREQLELPQNGLRQYGGPSHETVRLIESIGRPSYRAQTLAQLNKALLWKPGVAQSIVDGEASDDREDWEGAKFPLNVVSVETGSKFSVDDMAQFNNLMSTGKYLMERKIPGFNYKVYKPETVYRPAGPPRMTESPQSAIERAVAPAVERAAESVRQHVARDPAFQQALEPLRQAGERLANDLSRRIGHRGVPRVVTASKPMIISGPHIQFTNIKNQFDDAMLDRIASVFRESFGPNVYISYSTIDFSWPGTPLRRSDDDDSGIEEDSDDNSDEPAELIELNDGDGAVVLQFPLITESETAPAADDLTDLQLVGELVSRLTAGGQRDAAERTALGGLIPLLQRLADAGDGDDAQRQLRSGR